MVKKFRGGSVTVKLFFQALMKFISGVILVGLLIFLPAGSFSYCYGWLFMGVLFVPMLVPENVISKAWLKL